MAIQIGKYKRPGIFIEEFDNSVIASPTVAGISTVVIGFSKKGPFNTPVLLQNTSDLEKIFGTLDRNLERKGSFFHRTVSKMLESSPVYAMSLLATDDTLDKIEYKSLSTSTDKSNDVTREGAYRKFFDTTTFWKRDTDDFINLTANDNGAADRLLSFTNMSDRYVTIFIFKSKLKGFDTTMLEWYGTADKVPLYVHQLDYASDYMVDVAIVGGDWSNYQQLSVDSKWSTYFTSNGLLKDKVSDFVNDRNVNVLGYYEGLSLIPFFRDSNGKNIFIETNINADTDKTGVFCYFDADKFEGDFPNGMIDLIGNNLLTSNSLTDMGQSTIDFLSYNATITESLSFDKVVLDNADGTQQVFAFGPSAASLTRTGDWGTEYRTTYFSEGYVNGVAYDLGAESISGSVANISLGYQLNYGDIGTTATYSSAYAVVGGSILPINGGSINAVTFSISASSYTNTTALATYSSVFYVNSSTGTVEVKSSTTTKVKPTLSTNDLPLGYVTFNVQGGTISNATYSNVYVNSTEFVELSYNTDYTVTEVSAGKIKIEFLGTNATDVTNNYELHRKIRLFNSLITLLDSENLSKGTMLKDLTTGEKFSLSGASITNVVSSATQNKSFIFNLGLTSTPTDILNGNLIIYGIDNEMIVGKGGLITTNDQRVSGATYGVVAKNSDLYNAFYNGQISSGDYIYHNLTSLSLRVVFINTGTQSYIYFDQEPYNDAGVYSETIIIPDSTSNTGSYIIDGPTNYYSSLTDPVTGSAFTSGYAYRLVDANVTDEDLSSVTIIYDGGDSGKSYLQMYLDSSSNLTINFLTQDFTGPSLVDATLDSSFRIVSNKSNYKQSIEIEEPTGYTPVVNKILINAVRYSEVKIGDFLEASVDTANLQDGEVGRNLTRIISKKTYAADTTLVEVTCDAAINKVSVNGDLQTLRYTTLDNYVTTYKAIPLKGFRVREASMPDGTETRQSAILNLVSKGTSLFKAITNKESIDFRYLVDSFGLGLIERSKQQLVDICGERLDCLGFLNMPSMKMFKNSSSPSFLTDGVLDTALIAQGGDLESSPAFLYSFGDGKGVSSVGYFLPYVTVSDNGRPFDVPPAMFVASTYMRKQNTNVTSITPWTIAAGVTNGKITNIAGLEQSFTPQDIENLNGAQMNPIVYKRNRGFVIETENTAQTLYRSALSYLHVREVLIELERELSAMLLEFQWKFNTADVRAEIKLRADVICEKFINRNGLYNYFNKCDEENNTQTIIDNQIGVLDTYVEPIKGMGVIVNNVTILRTGAIESGGFQ